MVPGSDDGYPSPEPITKLFPHFRSVTVAFETRRIETNQREDGRE